jgi:hypothetical protein
MRRITDLPLNGGAMLTCGTAAIVECGTAIAQRAAIAQLGDVARPRNRVRSGANGIAAIAEGRGTGKEVPAAERGIRREMAAPTLIVDRIAADVSVEIRSAKRATSETAKSAAKSAADTTNSSRAPNPANSSADCGADAA